MTEVYRFQGKDIPTREDIMNCLHCGLCLPTCPTYALTGMEKYSPRGRIRMMKLIAEGEMSMAATFLDSISLCLGCQACETACPAGVPYGRMLNFARHQIETQIKPNPIKRATRYFFLKALLPVKTRFVYLARLISIIQRFQFDRLLLKQGVRRFLPKILQNMLIVAPEVKEQFADELLQHHHSLLQKKRYRVGFSTGCFMNVMFPEECLELGEVLEINGCEVVIPENHPCCGSVNGHNGDLEGARALARQTIDTFERLQVDYVVLNSAGCSAFMREYQDLLRDDPKYGPKAVEFSRKVRDFTEFLVEIGFKKPEKRLNYLVTYDEPCHLIHGYQQVRQAPRELIRSIPGIKLIELEESDWCCGSAGIYNLLQYDTSMQLLDRKMEKVKQTGAEILLSGNPGCLAQLRLGVKRHGLNIKVMHPVTLLRMAYDHTNTGNSTNYPGKHQ